MSNLLNVRAKHFVLEEKKLKKFAKDGLLWDYVIFVITLTNQLVEHGHGVFVTKLFLLLLCFCFLVVCKCFYHNVWTEAINLIPDHLSCCLLVLDKIWHPGCPSQCLPFAFVKYHSHTPSAWHFLCFKKKNLIHMGTF